MSNKNRHFRSPYHSNLFFFFKAQAIPTTKNNFAFLKIKIKRQNSIILLENSNVRNSLRTQLEELKIVALT